jgi:hypothetical protein
MGLSGSFGPGERLPLIYFIVGFPVVILGVFTWLVISHSNRLFAPSDFRDEANYVALSRAVQEANVTVEQLRRLMRPIIRFSLAQLTYSNRFDGMPDREPFLEALIESATEFGLTQDPTIQATLREFYHHETWDRYDRFVFHVLSEDHQVELGNSLAELSRRETLDFPTRDAIENLISGNSLSPAAQLLLQEYVEYAATKGRLAGVTAS